MTIGKGEIPKNANRDVPENDEFLGKTLLANIALQKFTIIGNDLRAIQKQKDRIEAIMNNKQEYDALMKKLQPYNNEIQTLEKIATVLEMVEEKYAKGELDHLDSEDTKLVNEQTERATTLAKKLTDKLKRAPEGDLLETYIRTQQLQPIAQAFAAIENIYMRNIKKN